MFSRALLFRRRWLTALLVVSSGVLELSALETTTNDSIAVVTSARGDAAIVSAGMSGKEIEPHQSLLLSGAKIETSEKSYLFLAFSNGLGMGIDSSTIVHCQSYTQEPFKANRENLDFEPSISKLLLELEAGALSFVCERLSPRSQIRVITPNGTLRIHSAHCHIEINETGTKITVYSGTATFYYPDGESREFLSHSTSIRISPQSAAMGKIAEKIGFEDTPKADRVFTEAAQHATKRVHFKAPKNGNTAEPILIMPLQTFEQPTARPYEYQD